MPWMVGGEQDTLLVRGGEPVTMPAPAVPIDPVAGGYSIPRGGYFLLTQAYQFDVYHEYYFMVDAVKDPVGAGVYYTTSSSLIIRMLTNTEADDDAGMQIFLYVRSRNRAGATNPSDFVIFSTSARSYEAGIDALLNDDDYDDASIAPVKLTTDATDRMFDDANRSLEDTTDGVTRYAAIEPDADRTAGRTSGDTANVAGESAGAVKNNAQAGRDADTKIDADVGANRLESTTGAQGKVDARVAEAEMVNSRAYKTVDGLYLLFHQNNVPTLLQLGIPNVENKSVAEILSELTLSNIKDDAGLTADNLGAIQLDGSNAPNDLKNSRIRLEGGELIGAGGGVVTAEDLGLGAFANKTIDDIFFDPDHGLSIAKLQFTGFSLDHVNEGASFVRMTPVDKQVVQGGRQVWNYDEKANLDGAIAGDQPTDVAFLNTGAGGTREWLFTYVKLPQEDSVTLSVWAAYLNAAVPGSASMDFELWDPALGLLRGVNTVIATGGALVFNTFRGNLDVSDLIDYETYWFIATFAEVSAADTLTVRGGAAYALFA